MFKSSGLPVIAAGVIAASLASCGQAIVTVEPGEAERFAAEVDEIVENSLVALSEGDFERHIRDFDEAMMGAVDEPAFDRSVEQIIGKLGAYQSKTVAQVIDQGEFRAVIYTAVFENDPEVKVRMVFVRDDPDHRISGMWFDSNLLQQ